MCRCPEGRGRGLSYPLSHLVGGAGAVGREEKHLRRWRVLKPSERRRAEKAQGAVCLLITLRLLVAKCRVTVLPWKQEAPRAARPLSAGRGGPSMSCIWAWFMQERGNGILAAECYQRMLRGTQRMSLQDLLAAECTQRFSPGQQMDERHPHTSVYFA